MRKSRADHLSEGDHGKVRAYQKDSQAEYEQDAPGNEMDYLAVLKWSDCKVKEYDYCHDWYHGNSCFL